MHCHSLRLCAIAGDLREFAINISAHPDGEINVHDGDRCDYDEKQPKSTTVLTGRFIYSPMRAKDCNAIT
jgi:hypothetical protein